MSFELQPNQSVADGIRRIEIEQIDSALEQLTTKMSPETRDKSVHEARKSFKRLRAVARLVRDELGEEAYRREATAFRDVGRALSAARDATVLVDALDALTENVEPIELAQSFAPLREILLQGSAQGEATLSPESLDRVVADLQTARQRVAAWPLARDGWDPMERGLRRLYGAGRDAFEQAYRHPAFERFHEWRKRGKDLWHALELLSPIWPELMAPLADQVHHLSDLLGDDHDLAILRQTIQDDPGTAAFRSAVDALVGLIEARRTQLQSEARILGRRLYCERPRRLMQRLQAYWDTWHTSHLPPKPVDPPPPVDLPLTLDPPAPGDMPLSI